MTVWFCEWTGLRRVCVCRSVFKFSHGVFPFRFLCFPPCLSSCSTQQSPSWAIYCLACSISLPGQHLFPSLSVLSWPFSCWLIQALRRQVCSTSLIHHKKIPKLFLFPPTQSFNASFCPSLDGFVQDPPNTAVFGVRRTQGVHWFCTTNLLSRAFWEW